MQSWEELPVEFLCSSTFYFLIPLKEGDLAFLTLLAALRASCSARAFARASSSCDHLENERALAACLLCGHVVARAAHLLLALLLCCLHLAPSGTMQLKPGSTPPSHLLCSGLLQSFLLKSAQNHRTPCYYSLLFARTICSLHLLTFQFFLHARALLRRTCVPGKQFSDNSCCNRCINVPVMASSSARAFSSASSSC